MITFKLKIKNLSNTIFVQQKQKDYSYAFRKLYNNFNNKSIYKTIAKKFNLDSWEFQSLKVEVETKIKQNQAFKIKMNNKQSDFDTMSSLIKNQVRDVKGFRIKLLEKLFECKTWKTLFDFFKQTKLKYRRSLDSLESMGFKEFSLNNKKSLVTLYCY